MVSFIYPHHLFINHFKNSLFPNLGFPGGSDSKESACNAEELDLLPWLGRSPGGGHNNPHQYSCLENPYGQRRLAGYSPWYHKELDMFEQLSTYFLMCIIYLFKIMSQ